MICQYLNLMLYMSASWRVNIHVSIWTCQHIGHHRNKCVYISVGTFITISRMCRHLNVLAYMSENRHVNILASTRTNMPTYMSTHLFLCWQICWHVQMATYLSTYQYVTQWSTPCGTRTMCPFSRRTWPLLISAVWLSKLEVGSRAESYGSHDPHYEIPMGSPVGHMGQKLHSC